MACSGCSDIRRQVAVARLQLIVMDSLIESVLHGERDERAEHLHRLLKVVNALLNTGGGVVCIHARDPYLVGQFDERIDNKLCALIPDPSLFHENFERSIWDKQHILIRVTYRRRPLSTLAVNSKLLRDTGLQDMTCHHALGWVRAVSNEDSAQSAPNANYIEIPTFVKDEPVSVSCGVFQESSSIQVKSIPDDVRNRPLRELINYIWDRMALAKYISALSKLPDGGYMYYGVSEEKDRQRRTGRFISEGITLSENDKYCLRLGIQGKIKRDMLWLSRSGPVRNPIVVNFRPVQNAQSNRYVIEVAVKYFHGLCFYDAQGPLSYEFVRGSLEPVKVDVDAWVWQYSGTLSQETPSFTHNTHPHWSDAASGEHQD